MVKSRSMTTTNWIAVSGIVVAALVALYSGYAQRRQMRQIEANRLDPSVGLKPPTHPLVVFIGDHWGVFVALYAAIALGFDLRRQGPITRFTIAAIALNAMNVAFGVLLELLWLHSRATFALFRQTLRHQEALLDLIHEAIKTPTKPSKQ